MTHITLISYPLVAYAPVFVAESAGLFADEGIKIDFVLHRGGWPEMNAALLRGDADVAIGNMWFAGRWSKPSDVLPVAYCVQQCGSVLVTTEPRRACAFGWDDLRGATVIVQSDVPTPWIAFRECLFANDIELGDVRVLVGIGTDEAVAGLRAGAVDYALMHVERCQSPQLLEVASLADVIGPVPWSVCFADRSRVAAEPDAFLAFRRAIERALETMAVSSTDEVAALLGGQFPDLAECATAAILGRLRRMQAWPSTAAIPVDDVVRWRTILHRWGMSSGDALLQSIAGEGSAIVGAGLQAGADDER